MADNYEGQQGQPGDPENEMGAEGESWQDDQPPVDDFADHIPEETATVSEETEMPVESEEHAVAARKTSPVLPIVAGIGGVLFLGALLYWQFGSSSSIPSYQEQPLKMPSQSAVMTNALTPTTPGNPTSNVAPGATGQSADATDISNLKAPEPGSSDVAPTSALAPVSDVPPPTLAAASASKPAATQQAAAKSAPALSAPPASTTTTTTTTASKASVSAPVQATPSAPAVDSATETRVNALANQVEELQKQLQQANLQLSQVNAQLAAASEKAAEQPKTPAVESPAFTEPKHKHVASRAPKHKTERHKAVAHEVPSPTLASSSGTLQLPGTMAASPSVPAAAPHWVLRAATPDEAWVAADATTPDLRHVQKGDELPGIGRIRAIRQTSTGWMIEGSQANLR